jgi:hypothetical protein
MKTINARGYKKRRSPIKTFFTILLLAALVGGGYYLYIEDLGTTPPPARAPLAPSQQEQVPTPSPTPDLEPLSAPAVPPAPAPKMRIWTSTTGYIQEAEFVQLIGDKVLLKKPGGDQVKVPLSLLCADDLKYLESVSPPTGPEKEVMMEQTADPENTVAPVLNRPVPEGSTTWLTVNPREFTGAINNPLKGYRAFKKNGYGLLERPYVTWRSLERTAEDGVERIIDETNKIMHKYRGTNLKIVPRVYLDWDDREGQQSWPSDMQRFDYDSQEFHERLRNLIKKLGMAWDNDPRVYAIQMGLIGKWGEHHSPSPTTAQIELLTEEFKKAFKNKPVLVRNTDKPFMDAGFGIYYDTFAYIGREPPHGPHYEFPWVAMNKYTEIWKNAPIEGEVEYNWQKKPDAKAEETFGRTPTETMLNPDYRKYMIDKVRKYHASYMGWINGYNANDPATLEGAGEIQKAFGYRFVLESFGYTPTLKPGGEMKVKLSVRNTGSAPFYINWPVAVGLLDAKTHELVWSETLNSIDIRTWMPGEKWNSNTFAYDQPAKLWTGTDTVKLPRSLPRGEYIVALAILDREGGMVPSARFAIENYITGGWHPLGCVGVGETTQQKPFESMSFDSPAFDSSIVYKVPEALLKVKGGDIPKTSVKQWESSDAELINPWRHWSAWGKTISHDGPVHGPAGRKVIHVKTTKKRDRSLSYNFFDRGRLPMGSYRMSFRAKGTAGLKAKFAIQGGGVKENKESIVPLTRSWGKHVIEFQVTESPKNESILEFKLHFDDKGTFSLTDYHLTRLK